MAKKEMKFEEAMGALEQIVRQLESGNVPLDEALDKFKEGSNVRLGMCLRDDSYVFTHS